MSRERNPSTLGGSLLLTQAQTLSDSNFMYKIYRQSYLPEDDRVYGRLQVHGLQDHCPTRGVRRSRTPRLCEVYVVQYLGA